MSYLFGKASDYNNFLKQVRGFVQGHPQVQKSNLKDPQSGITITGTGNGELYVSTESYTPAGNPGSPAGSPLPGTKYRLTCTVGGSSITSPKAQFTVEQIGVSPSILGTLTVGERFSPDQDWPESFSSPAGSPGSIPSPELPHGLDLFLTTSNNWVVSDTVEFNLVDHFIGRSVNDNFEEQLWRESAPTVEGDYVTRWHTRIPSIASASASPQRENYAHFQTNFVNASSYFNVGISGGAAFVASNDWDAQPSSAGKRYMYLSNIPFAFWLVCDADGFYAVARIGGVYQHITHQLIDIFATGNQHGLPQFYGAMGTDSQQNSTQTDNDDMAAFFDPGINSTALFRWVDGTYYTFQNRGNAYVKAITNTNWILPYCARDSLNNYNDGTFSTPMQFGKLSHQMIARYDGSFETLPITLAQTTPQNAILGDLKFIKYVTGNGVNSEDTTTDTVVSPNVEYIAFQNAQLTDNDHYAVMQLV